MKRGQFLNNPITLIVILIALFCILLYTGLFGGLFSSALYTDYSFSEQGKQIDEFKEANPITFTIVVSNYKTFFKSVEYNPDITWCVSSTYEISASQRQNTPGGCSAFGSCYRDIFSGGCICKGAEVCNQQIDVFVNGNLVKTYYQGLDIEPIDFSEQINLACYGDILRRSVEEFDYECNVPVTIKASEPIGNAFFDNPEIKLYKNACEYPFAIEDPLCLPDPIIVEDTEFELPVDEDAEVDEEKQSFVRKYLIEPTISFFESIGRFFMNLFT